MPRITLDDISALQEHTDHIRNWNSIETRIESKLRSARTATKHLKKVSKYQILQNTLSLFVRSLFYFNSISISFQSVWVCTLLVLISISLLPQSIKHGDHWQIGKGGGGWNTQTAVISICFLLLWSMNGMEHNQYRRCRALSNDNGNGDCIECIELSVTECQWVSITQRDRLCTSGTTTWLMYCINGESSSLNICHFGSLSFNNTNPLPFQSSYTGFPDWSPYSTINSVFLSLCSVIIPFGSTLCLYSGHSSSIQYIYTLFPSTPYH